MNDFADAILRAVDEPLIEATNVLEALGYSPDQCLIVLEPSNLRRLLVKNVPVFETNWRFEVEELKVTVTGRWLDGVESLELQDIGRPEFQAYLRLKETMQ